MTVAQAQPSTNGVVRIARKGIILFAFGDDPPFQVDVVSIHDEWLVIDKAFRDVNDAVPPDQSLQYSAAKVQFVQAIAKKAYAGLEQFKAPELTHAECFEFIAKIFEEVDKLRPFFVPKLQERPSSPENTEIRFSQ